PPRSSPSERSLPCNASDGTGAVSARPCGGGGLTIAVPRRRRGLKRPQPRYWKIADEPKATALVDALASTPGPNRWPYSTEFVLRAQGVSCLVVLPKQIYKPWIVVGKALNQMHADGSRGLTAFERCIDANVKTLLTEFRAQRGPCWFVLPIKVPFSLRH